MENQATLGVDVCKAFLDACLLRPGARPEERRFANSPEGIAALLAWGGDAPVVGMESTGGYERDLAAAAALAGRLVRVENPRRVRDFARATGRLNKTDRADARALAGFLARVEGRPWRLADPASRELEGLTAHRAALLEERTRLTNRLERRESLPALVARHLETRRCALDDELRETDAERGRLARADARLARDLAALTGMTGVGETTALLVLARAGNVEDFPDAQAYAAAAGLAPCRRGVRRVAREVPHLQAGRRVPAERALHGRRRRLPLGPRDARLPRPAARGGQDQDAGPRRLHEEAPHAVLGRPQGRPDRKGALLRRTPPARKRGRGLTDQDSIYRPDSVLDPLRRRPPASEWLGRIG